MSSHHVVRDQQEPALIIANGEACSESLLSELLEWSPYVVVLDGAIHRVLPLQIKIDVLLGDFDRNEIPLEEVKRKQDSIEIVYAPNQNKTDLEKAIDFLIERGHKAVNIIWATGKRSDHTMGNITGIVKYKDQITITLLDDYSVIYQLPSLPSTFSKWYTKGTPISLIPIGVVTGITTENLVYNLTHESLRLGYRIGTSNEVENDGIIRISCESGDLLMMECRD